MGTLKSASISFLHGMHVVALAHVMTTLRGSALHHIALTVKGRSTTFGVDPKRASLFARLFSPFAKIVQK